MTRVPRIKVLAGRLGTQDWDEFGVRYDNRYGATRALLTFTRAHDRRPTRRAVYCWLVWHRTGPGRYGWDTYRPRASGEGR